MLKRLFLIAGFSALTAVLLFISVYSLIKIDRLQQKITRQQEFILSETEEYRNLDDYHNQMDQLLSSDLNQLRASLGLSVKEYPVYPPAGNTVQDNENTTAPEFYDGITVLLGAMDSNRKAELLGRFFRSEIIEDVIKSENLLVKKQGENLYELGSNDFAVVSVSAPSLSEVLFRTFNGKTLKTSSPSKETAIFIQTALSDFKLFTQEREKLKKTLTDTIKDKEITDACGKEIRIIILDNQVEFSARKNSNSFFVSIEDGKGSPAIRISGDDNSYFDEENLKKALLGSLSLMDLRAPDEILLDVPKARIEGLYNDPDFLSYLDGLGLSLSEDKREDNDYIYYDILQGDGSRLGSFSILKKLGEIYLVDADEVPVSSLKTLSIVDDLNSDRKKKLIIPENIPEIETLYSGEDTVNFLLVGTHELNTDTMILAHADKRSGKAYLIGIPRDLYWKGRKINRIYDDFGAEQFKKELSEITGLEITNYIKIDMYAFIDIVNILGGIEVTLEEDLIDPTYRTRENGQWSTLNYKKGTYTLNGVEALRIARSRHGSNDFDRSHRQQLIIESFLNKFKELKISDINKVYSLIQVMSRYVTTDFSLTELMSIYNNFGDASLAGKFVLSFDNILYDTYSNLYMLDDKDFKPGPDYNKGAWILLPEGNNWNNIRWYIRKIINGEMPVE